MIKRRSLFYILTFGVLALSSFAFAEETSSSQENPKQTGDIVVLGTFRDWVAYKQEDTQSMVCWIVPENIEDLNQKKSTKPQDDKEKHEAHASRPTFMIAEHPQQNVKNEVSFIHKSVLAAKKSVKLLVDKTGRFEMTPVEDSAWIENVIDESRLVNALRKGASLKIEGQNHTGQNFSYSVSLSGFDAAYNASVEACKL